MTWIVGKMANYLQYIYLHIYFKPLTRFSQVLTLEFDFNHKSLFIRLPFHGSLYKMKNYKRIKNIFTILHSQTFINLLQFDLNFYTNVYVWRTKNSRTETQSKTVYYPMNECSTNILQKELPKNPMKDVTVFQYLLYTLT